MTQLEAHMAAEVVAAELLSEDLNLAKLWDLRERIVDVVMWLDYAIDVESDDGQKHVA